MEKDFNISDTREINAILEETRNRNHSAKNPDNVSNETRVFSNGQQENFDFGEKRPDIPDDGYVDIADIKKGDDMDGYVDISDPNARNAENHHRSSRTKKKSRAGLIIGIIAGAVVLLGAGILVWYLNSGSSTFAKNVTVNGVSIAGMNTAQAKEALKPVEDDLSNAIRLDIDINGETVTLDKTNFTYRFDTDKILKSAKEYSEKKGLKSGEQAYTIKMTVDADSCKKDVEKIAKDHKKEPADAYVTDYDSAGEGSFTFQSEVEGMSVETEKLQKQVEDSINAGKLTASITAPVSTVEPKITKEYLSKNIKKLSSFTTTSTNSSNGNNNMKISLAACNNSIIDPKKTWSFNQCTGDSNLESNGYLPAGVIVEGRHETGVGGGICQSSTTIYNAAILCGMQVVERSCHYYQSAYVDAGRDATVDYGNLDLQLENPFSTQLFMKCYMDGVVLHCEMYGVPQEDFDKIEFKVSRPSYTSSGFKVTAKRIYLKDGKEVREEDLPSSTYYTSAPDSDSDNAGSSSSSSSSGSGSSGSSSSGTSSDTSPEPAPDSGRDTDDGGADADDAGADDSGADTSGAENPPDTGGA